MHTQTPCDSTCKAPTGSLQAHCRRVGCHQTFATVESFDLHRRDDSVPEWEDNDCWLPGDIGLILMDGLWGTEDEHLKRLEVAEKMTKARAARAGGNKL